MADKLFFQKKIIAIRGKQDTTKCVYCKVWLKVITLKY
jgi:hypothetical protein